MTLPRARVLCACVLLALPASADAQARRPQSPTVFSPASQVGSVSVRAAVVLADYAVKPLPLMTVVARRNGAADSVTARTDLDGRLAMTLPVGSYTIRARMSPPMDGRAFSWAIPVVVRRAATTRVELTNANASSDSISAVVAAAPPEREPVARPSTPPPAERPVVERAPSPAPSQAPPTRLAETVARPVQPAAPAPRSSLSARRAEPTPYRANTSGFFLGFGLNGSALRSDDLGISDESGGGGSLQLGWGLTRNFALFLEGSGARIAGTINDYDLGHFDAGARWHFVSRTRALVPFVEVAFSGRAAMEDDVALAGADGTVYQGDLTIAGAGVSLGGGLQYFVARSWALGGSLKWTTGEFSRVQVNNVSVDGLEIDATSARFNLGFSWYPMGGGR